MSDAPNRPNLPSYEKLTAPSVDGLFAASDSANERSFLDSVFAPKPPVTRGRITPGGAKVSKPKGKCRVVADPVSKWLSNLRTTDLALCNLIHDEMKRLFPDRVAMQEFVRQAYANYLIAQEKAALAEQLAKVQSWRGAKGK